MGCGVRRTASTVGGGGVEDLAAGLGVQGRSWLAAALAVLSEDLEDTATPNPRFRRVLGRR